MASDNLVVRTNKRSKAYYLALLATAFTLVVVMLGAYTRLADAGLGCPDWPGCYGFLAVPESTADIQLAEARFPDSPVEIEKGWPEMVHRYAVGILGILVLTIAGMATLARMRGQTGQPFKLPLLLLAVIIIQALFGMWTVTLKLWPQIVTAHLLGGFTTLSLLLLLALRYRQQSWTIFEKQRPQWRRLQSWALLGLVIVALQISLGGWTASNYAAFACYDLPTCQQQWWPEMDLAAGFNIFQSVGPNYLGGLMDNEARVAIHMVHRLGAIFTSLYLLILIGLLYRAAGQSALRRFSCWLGVVLLLQVVLGLSNVYWQIPAIIAVAHNAGGAVLLLMMVALNYLLRSVGVRTTDFGTDNRGVNHG
ncbi:MAG: COX15/CtaA family protein [Pseudomonadales bacterium]